MARNLFRDLLTGGLLGGMRASDETRDGAEGLAPSTGDVRNLVAAGKAISSERPLTDDERRRVRKAFTAFRFVRRWFCALLAGGLLFGFGLYVFTQFVVPTREAGSLLNAVSWVSMIGGGSTLLACVVLPPYLVYKLVCVRLDLRGGVVRQTTGVLVKTARPPERYWLVGDRCFAIADPALWERFPDGATLTVDCLPRNGDILKVHSQHGSIDVLALVGY